MKKVIALSLVVALAMILFTACSGGGLGFGSGNSDSGDRSAGANSRTSGGDSSGASSGNGASDSGASGSGSSDGGSGTAGSATSGDSSSASSASDGGGGADSSGGNSNGGDVSSSSGSGSNAGANAPVIPFTPVKRDLEVPGSPPDLAADSTYYVIINGVQYDLMEVTIQDFLDEGFYLDRDEEDEDSYFNENTLVEPNSVIGSSFTGTSFYKAGFKGCIYLIPVNRTDHAIPVKDCEVNQILFNTRYTDELDIYTVCNLALGSTLEEVVSVFGDEYSSVGPDITYVDPSRTDIYFDRYICFIKDSDDVVYEIMIDTNKRVIYDWE